MDAITNEVIKIDCGFLNAELESRLGLYRLFGRLLSKEVDQQLLDDFINPEFAAAIKQLGIRLDQLTNADDLILQQLAIEFTRLFLGPGKHISPHESVQIQRDGMLNDATTVRVKRFIEVAGYQFRADSKKYPDHICSEFEFMEALIIKQIEAIANGDLEEAETSKMLQNEFLQRHLALWIPQFCDAIQRTAKLAFYQQTGQAVYAFIKMEVEQTL